MRLQNQKNSIHHTKEKAEKLISLFIALQLELGSSLGPLLKCHLVHIYATCKISVYSADFNFRKSPIQAKACLET